MEVQTFEGSQERRVLTAMVMNLEVLSGIALKWNEHTKFRSSVANTVANLCVSYYHAYGKCPEKNVEGLIRDWAEEHTQQKEDIQTLAEFMEGLSGDYVRLGEETNPRYVLDRADRIFHEMELRRIADGIQSALDAGKVKKAESVYLSYNPVAVSKDTGTHLFLDKEAFEDAFKHEEVEELVSYKGPIKRFFQNAFQREDLVAFIGPSGVGKTHLLIDVAWRAMCNRKRVAFFEIGDMSKRQIIQRFAVRAAMWPLYGSRIKRPVSIKLEDESCFPSKEEAVVVHEEQVFDKGLGLKAVEDARIRLLTTRIKSNNSYFWLEVRSASTITVSGIRSVLVELERRDRWTPDVICIDYSDLLALPSGFRDYRDQINENWKQMRQMAMDLKCLVVTATQSNRESFGARWISPKHISEDRRKQDAVSALFGINVTDEEKNVGVMRLNWLKNRHGDFSFTHGVHCAGCLALGNPIMRSLYSGKRSYEEKVE